MKRRLIPTVSGTPMVGGVRRFKGGHGFQLNGIFDNSSGFNGLILDSRTKSDSDVSAFLTATSISDATQTQALYFLVGALKTIQSTISGSLWSRMTALYPFVGGNATAHSKDLKGAYNLTFSAGWTHSNNGATPSNAYANTGITPSLIFNNTTFNSMSYYSRTAVNSSTSEYTMGASGSGGTHALIAGRPSPEQKSFYSSYLTGTAYYSVQKNSGYSPNSGSGLTLGTINATDTKLFWKGVLQAKNTVANSNTMPVPDQPIYIGCRNINNSPAGYTDKQCAFSHVGLGLSDADVINLSWIVQAYQTILGRQV